MSEDKPELRFGLIMEAIAVAIGVLGAAIVWACIASWADADQTSKAFLAIFFIVGLVP